MKFYFSAEYSGDIDKKIRFILNNILRKIEDTLGNKSYGEEIIGITAIPMILDERFSDHPERRYISRKERESDVRLRIDFESFYKGDFEQCCNLIYENCIKSYHYVYEKSIKRKDGDFHKHYDEFVKDFTECFNNLKNAIPKDEIEAFNKWTD